MIKRIYRTEVVGVRLQGDGVTQGALDFTALNIHEDGKYVWDTELVWCGLQGNNRI